MSAAALVSLNQCATMREPLEEPQRIEVGYSDRAARRRRSLRRGIDRWHFDVTHAALPGPVWLLALTFSDDDPLAARGKIRDFWAAFRDIAPGLRYFSWLELQRRGAPHYHAIVMGAPFKLQREIRHWIQGHWPWASIQPSVQTRSWQWFRQAGGNYVKAYAKKRRPADPSPHRFAQPIYVAAAAGALRSKAYQQDYDQVPRELRTFQSNRTTFALTEIDQHLLQFDIAWTYDPDPVTGRIATGWVLARLSHAPAPGGCRLNQRKRTRRTHASGSHLRRTGASTTRRPGGVFTPAWTY